MDNKKYVRKKHLTRARKKNACFAMYVAYLQAAWDGNQAGCQDEARSFH